MSVPDGRMRIWVPDQEKTSQKEEIQAKLLQGELLKHQTERKELEDKLKKLKEEKVLDSNEIESLKQNLKSHKQQLDDAHKEKERRMFVEKKFIESLSLFLEGGDLVDEEFDAAQTKVLVKVKEMMQGPIRVAG